MGPWVQSVSKVMEDVCLHESAVRSIPVHTAQTNVKTNRAMNAGKEEERLTGVIYRDS